MVLLELKARKVATTTQIATALSITRTSARRHLLSLMRTGHATSRTASNRTLWRYVSEQSSMLTEHDVATSLLYEGYTQTEVSEKLMRGAATISRWVLWGMVDLPSDHKRRVFLRKFDQLQDLNSARRRSRVSRADAERWVCERDASARKP
tara:strand:+ start:81 stop:533 length:453 start_codon:yes stop_codon:yes gene_type:complete